ncbi:bifunctional phosphoribosyl-AMP cyclohydrolase/phosphoribosyl-ATP diphosphatase HisIE [Helicobacter jaachi]|uniref:Histidine biosynthesis bifunctional protein HisIE n=1 Tax=Helicobacter jaachi TaxID=1677920 RepID=A0A4V6I2G9_9HELI|nr:bifunctional phosphoribosyl-AMP cyclohydrolase/phosphoribosyl-ATP diphosphatase HisIE [Helicobacter jaachi]TLD96052.1 bifunctional phosphoribosyl-AMP cyclohydrolase/phosphoribosyl-ATP diphosphatase HisIE [Helicobacter jaachi]
MQDGFERIEWERYELIPTIVQEYQTHKVLMLAYSSKQSLELTLQTHLAHYFSRSKHRIWQKGEQSGHIQRIKEIRLDCDNDSLLFIVEQVGVACHTGEKSCFFQSYLPTLGAQPTNLASQPQKLPIYHILDELYHTIEQRRGESVERSYTASLLAKGANGVGKKIIEEAGELSFALKDGQKEEIIYECADLFYHILVGLALEHISPELVLQELRRRTAQSGIDEKASRKNK